MKLEFDRAEYEKRFARAVDLMAHQDLDALFITGETNLNYFSGWRHFAPWTTFTRPTILILPRSGRPVLVIQGFLVEDARRDSWLDDIRGYPALTGTPVNMVAGILNELGLAGRRIGAELGYEQRLGLPYLDLVQLMAAAGNTEFADASHLLWELRMQKSPAEVAAHRQACDLAARAFQEVFALSGEGTTELEVARIANRSILDGGGEPGFTIICSGRGNYERVAGMPTGRALQKGDLLWFDLGVVFNGCWCDHCRAGVVGGPSSEQTRLQDQVHQITMKGVQAIRPGIPASAVARACIDEAKRLGLDFNFEAGRLGHGMGLNSTEPPHIALYDDTILQPGMVITVEPGIVNDLGTFIAEENVAVTETGFDLLSSAPRELHLL